MRKATHPNTRYGKGSTGLHTAISPQASDGGSGGVPLNINTPSLRKPAVLARKLPDPSQGTPGTAISADLSKPGVAPSRPRGFRGLASTFSRLERWQAQLYREYLEMELLALLYAFMLRYLRLVVQVVWVCRDRLFLATTFPFVVLNRFVHDRRYALFRRGAVASTP